MINFYKQDGIGKIAFNDGNIYVPQGNVTLLLDTTTEKIIVAEDERLIYWISLSQPLEVNGTQISGTDAEKLALIAPVFQNEGGGSGTGGASARFGYPGEDVTSDVDRSVDMGGKYIHIDNSSEIDYNVTNGTDQNGELYVAPDNVQLYIEDATLGEQAQVEVQNTFGQLVADLSVTNNLTGDNRSFTLTSNGAKISKTNAAQSQTYDLSFTEPIANRTMPLSAQGIFADDTGNIPLVPTQSFDSNAEAVAALGVGMLYKSTTLINGSPIILITV